MKKFILTVLVFAALCLQAMAATNMYIQVRTPSGDGWNYDWLEVPVMWTTNGILIPRTEHASLGTEDDPLEHVYCTSNSLVVGGVTISAEDGGIRVNKLSIGGRLMSLSTSGVLRLPQIEVESPGVTSWGRGRFKKDIEIEEPYRGMIHSTSNTTWGESKWIQVLNQSSADRVTPVYVKVADSPEVDWTTRVARIEAAMTNMVHLLYVNKDGYMNPPVTNLHMGTTNNPIQELVVSANSLTIGNQKMSQSDVARSKGIGKTKTLKRVSGNLTATNTAWTVLPGMSATFTPETDMKVQMLVSAFGRVTGGETLRLTVFIDGSNAGASGGISATRDAQIGNLGFSVLTPSVLTAGVPHTIDLRARVTGGSGTIYASGSDVPLIVSLMAIYGNL